VSGRSNIDFKGQVRLDVQYIENQSFWGDIKLLLMTVPAVLFSKGAY
jgi:lipopolysaccharide/colanic/teichoic acid biosynthesis glycosyltransferase